MYLVSGTLWLLRLFTLRFCMWIVEIDRYNLFRYSFSKVGLTLILLSPLQIEAICRLILSRCWHCSCLLKLLIINQCPWFLRLEDARVARLLFPRCLRIVLSNSWDWLLEIDIYSNRLDIVEWVLFIEWKTEISLVFHFGTSNVFLNCWRIILTWTYLYARVTRQHFRNELESFLLRGEILFDVLPFQTFEFFHLGVKRWSDSRSIFWVGAWTRIFVIQLFQLKITGKPLVFWSKWVLRLTNLFWFERCKSKPVITWYRRWHVFTSTLKWPLEKSRSRVCWLCTLSLLD